jgi:hypothetical protein
MIVIFIQSGILKNLTMTKFKMDINITINQIIKELMQLCYIKLVVSVRESNFHLIFAIVIQSYKINLSKFLL